MVSFADADASVGRIVCLDPAELKLEMEPLASLPLGPFRLRDGVPPTSIGDGGDDAPSLVLNVFESIRVAFRLSAKSLADNSFDRVLPIFFDGV